MAPVLPNRLVLLLFAVTGCSTSSSSSPADASSDVTLDTGAHDTGADVANLDAGFDSADGAPGVGFIACGSANCTIPSEVCCPGLDGGGACFARDAAPCTPIECDQPGDCAGGTICCYQFQAGCGGVSASCMKNCNGSVGACLGLDDCQTCVALTCAGFPLTTCGTDGLCCH